MDLDSAGEQDDEASALRMAAAVQHGGVGNRRIRKRQHKVVDERGSQNACGVLDFVCVIVGGIEVAKLTEVRHR